MSQGTTMAERSGTPQGRSGTLVKRHGIIVRLTHWINVLCLTCLLMSGLQIFNARPQLDFGKITNFDTPPISIGAAENGDKQAGYLDLWGHRFNTTGVLGLSKVEGRPTERAFPAWITLPSYQDLGAGRSIHFIFAWLFVLNGLLYLVYGFASRHFRRDIVPTGDQMRHIGASVRDHVRLRFPKGQEARSYNAIQKITYGLVIFILLPLVVVAGWTLSPGLNAAFPFVLDLFGGRQTARSVHFFAAFGIVLFFVVHVALVLVSGVFNNMRSMITGWYDIGQERETHV